MPWFPLPAFITTGREQPLIRASDPAAALALAFVLIDSSSSIKILPIATPHFPVNPSSEISEFKVICFSNKSLTSSKSTLFAYSKISFTESSS